MDINKKIEILNKFEIKQLSVITEEIFSKKGVSNIERVETSVLTGYINSIIGSDKKILILIYNERLSGIQRDGIYQIVNKIINSQTTYNPSEIYLLSTSTVSQNVDNEIKESVSQIHIIGRDNFIELIDQTNPDVWKKGDPELINYEKYIIQKKQKIGIDLEAVPFFNSKYQKLLNIYIEPTLYHYYEEPRTKTLARRRCTISNCIEEKKPLVVSGGAGTGKSTLLKKIGEMLFSEECSSGNRRRLPVFISISDILDSNYAPIQELIVNELSKHLSYTDIDTLILDYDIVIIIDSLDELNKENQKQIINQLIELYSMHKTQFIIASRDREELLTDINNKDIQKYSIQNFNLTQIQKFIASFFLGEKAKTDSLLDALKENRILDRLPLNPLTLSLISILYEENNFEVPATISDIYNNFNSLILGRFSVSSRAEFIDISFKERVLSIYALLLLEKEEHRPLLLDEFYSFFEDYYKDKTIPIPKEKIRKVLKFIINHTGVLAINENNRVQFTHDSYMEYYASLEIFKHQREKDDLLISNFFDSNWQNTAIFFAGMSKDMPIFLEKVIAKVQSAKILPELYSSVYGSGYILQALYQTDNIIRKRLIIEALDNNIKAYENIRRLAEDDMILFKNYSIPILSTMSLMFFFESFNSITLKSPLQLAFDDVYNKYNETNSTTDGYRLLNLAFTLDSKRLLSPEFIEKVINKKEIMNNPELYAILDATFTVWGSQYNILKKDVKKQYYDKVKNPLKILLESPAKKLKFSNVNLIGIERKVKLIVEGPTDIDLLQYAYSVLTGGELPYWDIKIAGGNQDRGGAAEVAKCLNSANPILDNDQFLIGIFDHDAKGMQEYNSLKNNLYEEKSLQKIKKHKNKNIFGVLIPIPGDMPNYYIKEQAYNVFEIEHYFGDEYLKAKEMVEECSIRDVYSIKDKKKKEFSSQIKKESDPELFKYFRDLFEIIDSITNSRVHYVTN
ncbi:NACHT domain-containing protein [Dysgonomonas sp. 521]|uniref:NACHT domain-containing protein n=1 Tax=Dysgonomonas sp. 521 TaxID=2302932 RepID=UPI0013D8CEAE|nr:NACHT domain-containing protein [Dysgonomonas sp. 521]NDV96903.1 NACHT domain-containing protein [Dysgonomonas sp. 521]